MYDNKMEEENFIEDENTVEEIIKHLREKELKLLNDLIIVQQAIKYQQNKLEIKIN